MFRLKMHKLVQSFTVYRHAVKFDLTKNQGTVFFQFEVILVSSSLSWVDL